MCENTKKPATLDSSLNPKKKDMHKMIILAKLYLTAILEIIIFGINILKFVYPNPLSEKLFRILNAHT